MVAGTDPDVVLMDLNVPRLDGTEATRRLSRSHPHLSVVVLTTYTDDQQVFAARQAGARGYLTKDAGAREIEAAVCSAARGQAHLDPDVQRRLLDLLRSGTSFAFPAGGSSAAVAPDASPRTLEVASEDRAAPTGSPGGRSTSCGASPPGTPTPRSPPPCSCPRRP
jgi:DNA-binding NarL/FixJ family response regulator